ncbi:MAG: arylsulfatase [Burkholderiales bacterium]
MSSSTTRCLPGPGFTCALVLAALLACGPAVAAVPGKARPNIVLLLADDWGFSDVGAFGGEIATPSLDELARRGVRFSNFHVTASCAPTRAMLLTGVDNHRNGVGNMPENIPREHLGRPGYLGVLDRNVVTVASLLRDGGYRTLMAGKWHLGHEAHNLPGARGFERSFIQADSGSDNWEGRLYLAIKDRVYWYENDKPAAIPKDFYSSTFFTDKALEYLRAGAGSGKPFFAYVAYQANHIPLQAPKAFVDKYRGKYKDGWTVLREERRKRAVELGIMPKDAAMVVMPTTRDWNTLSEAQKAYEARRMEVYAAMADAMDHEVGRLVAYLKSSGEYDNTVFLFLSDNGAEASDPYAVLSARLWLGWNYSRDIESLGAKGAYTIIGPSWASAAASPLSTYKFYGGEGGIRVPLIVAGPGIESGRIVNAFTHVSDIVPTLLQLAGVAAPAGSYQGRAVVTPTGTSLVSALRGLTDRVHDPEKTIGYELSGSAALFKGDYKLVRVLPPVGDGQWHLYDITADPGETRDLRAVMPELFERMQAHYEDYARANGVLPMPPDFDPVRQVQINAFYNAYLPRLARAAPWIVALLLAAAATMVWRRRRATAR